MICLYLGSHKAEVAWPEVGWQGGWLTGERVMATLCCAPWRLMPYLLFTPSPHLRYNLYNSKMVHVCKQLLPNLTNSFIHFKRLPFMTINVVCRVCIYWEINCRFSRPAGKSAVATSCWRRNHRNHLSLLPHRISPQHPPTSIYWPVQPNNWPDHWLQ